MARLAIIALWLALAGCAAAEGPDADYRLGLYAENPEPFGDYIGADDDIGPENDLTDPER